MKEFKELQALAQGYWDEAEKAFEADKLDKAMVLFQKADQLFEKIEDYANQVQVMARIGVCMAESGRREMANDLYLKTIDVCIRHGLHFAEARLLNNIGSEIASDGDNEKAIHLFLRTAEILKDKSLEKEPNYYRLCLIVYLNLTQCYWSVGDNKQAEEFMRKSWEASAFLGVESYAAAIRLMECCIHWTKGDKDFVNSHISGIMNTYLSGEHTNDLEQNIQILTKLLSNMGDFDRWQAILEVYQRFAEAQDKPYFYMVNADLWCDFYKAVGDTANYQFIAAEYREYAKKNEEGVRLDRAKELDIRLQMQVAKAEVVEDYMEGHRDMSTGTGNREKLEADFDDLLEEMGDNVKNIGVGIVDIVDFTGINRKRGYLGGDDLLRKMGPLLEETIGEYGFVYHIVGGKFILLLDDPNVACLNGMAEDIEKKMPVPVQQGYVFMKPKKEQELEVYLEQAKRALELTKEKNDGTTTVIELNQKDYHDFYSRYIANMEESAQLEVCFRQAGDKEEWLMNLEQRRSRNRELLKNNEELIDAYLHPILMGTEPLTEEKAIGLAYEVWNMYQAGYLDNLVMLEVAKFIEPMLSQGSHSMEHIYMLIVIAESYSRMNAERYFKEAYAYSQKLNLYQSYLPQIDKPSLRRTLFEALLKCGIMYAESTTNTLRGTIDYINSILNYYRQNQVREALRYSEEESDAIIGAYIVRALAGALLREHTVNPDRKEYKDAYDLTYDIYQKAMIKAKGGLVDDRLHAVFIRICWLLGTYTLEDCYGAHKDYFNASEIDATATDVTNLEKTLTFRMMIYYVPELVIMCHMSTPDFQAKEKSFIDSIIEAYMIYMSSLPKGIHEGGLSHELYLSLGRMINYLPDWVNTYDLVYKALVERNVDNSIHSRMVSEIGKLIAETIAKTKPEMFIGYLGFSDVDEVCDGFDKIREFMDNAGLIHDIGKIEINDIISQQIRRLTPIERDSIQMHPRFGALLIQNSEVMRQYVPIVEGHHRYFDDKGGYPEDYRYKDHKLTFFVNIISLADTLDAATDHIGRTYAKNKTLDEVLKEIESEKGTRYNDKIVDILLKDDSFREKMQYLSHEGREEICFEVFKSFQDEKREK